MVGFLAADFFAADFFAADFFAVVGFFAAGFSAADFFAVVFFVADFFSLDAFATAVSSWFASVGSAVRRDRTSEAAAPTSDDTDVRLMAIGAASPLIPPTAGVGARG